MDISTQKKFRIKQNHVILFIGVLLVVTGALLFYNYSFIEITIDSDDSEQKTIVLTNDIGEVVRNQTTDNDSIRLLTPRGNYNVLVQANRGSFFSTAQAPGMLQTRYIDADLQTEKSRKFIGDNPLSCMHYNNDILFSWLCNDIVDLGVTHTPGNQNNPTITNRLYGYGGATFNSSFQHDGKTFALVRSSAESTEAPPIHSVYPLTNEGRLDISNGRVLRDLSSGTTYYGTAYKDGFLIFDRLGYEVFLYESPYQPPEELSLNTPSIEGINLQSISVGDDDSIIMAYSQGTIPEFQRGSQYLAPQYINDDETNRPLINTTEVFIYKDGSVRNITFDFPVSQARLCGENLVCIGKPGLLEIYDVTTDGPVLKSKISDVLQSEDSPNGLLAVTSDGVALLNPRGGSGFFTYSFEDYEFCGINVRKGEPGYTLCIVDSDAKRYAIYIDETSLTNEPIDKIVSTLNSEEYISTVSVYESFVHILGEYGERMQTPDGYFLDRNRITVVNEDIEGRLIELGFDNAVYDLVFTVD
jgi:hypothetical protein